MAFPSQVLQETLLDFTVNYLIEQPDDIIDFALGYFGRLKVEAQFQGSAERTPSYLAISFDIILSLLTSPNRWFAFCRALKLFLC